ncbi:MAG TPA: alanine--tRNA ligase, partial [Iamia sp.]|nr:alanine--tRNA ligase [Iamia sp.]
LSFFEMLGNFSFGDYFKAEAIPFAWEFVTEVLGLDGDRLWVTVHVDDDEAEAIWRDSVGFPGERIQRLDKDNFWEMGDTGPCGPSSEIFWDYGPEFGPDGGPANPEAENRFVEFWNLVFTQYYRGADRALTDLPSKNVDTGAGFERMLGVLKGSSSLYAADSVSRMVDAAQVLTGVKLGEGEESDVALRLLADHARTMTFLIADGVIPSNEERGYVLRRIIRRAVRFAYLLGVDRPIAAPLAEKVAEVMGDAYPEVRSNLDLIWGVLDREEAQFRRTLRIGLRMLEDEMASLDEGATLSGNLAFTLHDTYGFPYEVTAEIAEDRGHPVDRAAFEVDMAEQKRLSKEGGRKNKGVEMSDAQTTYQRLLADHGATVFTGRDEESTQATVLAVVATDTEGVVDVFLDRTPFYAESGGQVGDTGTIVRPTGEAEVLDTSYAVPGLHRHRARLTEGTLVEGDVVAATIDGQRRAAIKRNHTGTHLLHWALHEVLGPHVKQQGSLVAPDRLRFDFSHYEPVTAEQIAGIEDLVNEAILVNDPVRHYETTKDEALAKGAIAFFGEKYGDRVRVLEAGRHSTELCGGTHVTATGDIGPMKIISEGSIGSNLRRIEAITGTGPIQRIRDEESVLARAAELVGVPVGELVEGIEKRLGEVKALRDEVGALKAKAAAGGASDLAGQAVDGIVVARVDGLDRDAVRTLALAVRDQPDVRAVVLGAAPDGGGVALVAAVTPDSGLEAGALIAEAARTVGGGGGKGADLAVAGGRNPDGLDEALDQARVAAGLAT